jgi:hypothetical protein
MSGVAILDRRGSKTSLLEQEGTTSSSGSGWQIKFRLRVLFRDWIYHPALTSFGLPSWNRRGACAS